MSKQHHQGGLFVLAAFIAAGVLAASCAPATASELPACAPGVVVTYEKGAASVPYEHPYVRGPIIKAGLRLPSGAPAVRVKNEESEWDVPLSQLAGCRA